jgi:glycosyltransferase involved in cell wall biosynthesis
MYTNAVVAGGSLRIAYEKGEIKKRYWNPGGVFDAVHVIVLADEDIEAEKVQRVAGDAELTIHPVGKFRIVNIYELRRAVCDRIQAIKPNIVRGHGPFLEGYYAVYAARKFGLPSYISIHDDISIYRRFWTYGTGYAKFTSYQLALKALGWERFLYANADRIVPRYEAAGRVLRNTKYCNKLEVIYNQVFLADFVDLKPCLARGETLKIINVGRQFAGKDQRPLIEALKGINASLTLIGSGPLRHNLRRTAERCGVADRVRFIDAVPNHRLEEVFRHHHVFAMNIIQPGISMTVMEAMAFGFPVVINQPRWEKEPEVSGSCACVVEGSAVGFREAFLQFLKEPAAVRRLGAMSRRRMQDYSGETMEDKECAMVRKLINSRGTGPESKLT